MKAVLVRKNGEYILHKYADSEVVFAMSNHEKADEKRLRYLDKKNCDTIFGSYSLEQMSEDYANNIKGITKDEKGLARISYFDGITKGIEMNKDKQFSESEMLDALTWADDAGANQILNKNTLIKYIEKLKEKRKEDAILVEIEMQYLPVSTFCFECGKGSEALNKTVCDKQYACSNWFPKYDDNGCLILRKIVNN
jgi:hypothetical protein